MNFRLVASLLLACSPALSHAQCDILVQDSFRFGLRPHGGNGQERDPQVGDTLNAYWPQLPAAVQWLAEEQGWFFAAASLDPLEVDPLDPFNGIAFIGGNTHGAAHLPFTAPSTRYTLSVEVALGQQPLPPIKIGYTSSPSLADNFAASGTLWLAVGFDASWQLFINGSALIASGQGDYSYSLDSGWLPVELSFDPQTSTASGIVGGCAFGPLPVTLTAATTRAGFEAGGNFFNAVNNFRIVRGTPLSVALSGPTPTPQIGGSTTFTASTNASAPSGIRWRHNGTTLIDGPTAWGSVISGSDTTALTISGIKPQDAGQYDAIVFNACANRASAAAALTLCYANCDASTTSPVLTANDFQCFLNKFAAADPYANCDGSTATPILTANDFQCFLNSYATGCP